jgi:hypothetical protein
MFTIEDLQQTGNGEYKEPEGEFLAFISENRNTISVLTRQEKLELPDPNEMTISRLEDWLGNHDLNTEQLAELSEKEQAGKNRKGAVEVLEEANS